jgi:hypothetical protein
MLRGADDVRFKEVGFSSQEVCGENIFSTSLLAEVLLPDERGENIFSTSLFASTLFTVFWSSNMVGPCAKASSGDFPRGEARPLFSLLASSRNPNDMISISDNHYTACLNWRLLRP